MLSNPLLLVPVVALLIVVGFGLLKMGHLINGKLREGRNRLWVAYGVGLVGVLLLLSAFVWPVNTEWSRALSALLIVPAIVTLINYKGK